MPDTINFDPGHNGDFIIDQNWDAYTPEEHAVWDLLYDRQMDILPGRAATEFLDGLKALKLDRGGIPDLERISDELEPLTGWRVVAVPGLVPDVIFFEHLANRRFPVSQFIRKRAQLDYLKEPDIFHDVFGHVPMLTNPFFADMMEAHGKGGLRAMKYDGLKHIAALYWYTVEFGLVRTDDGLRIWGAGIVSSKSESVFALEDASPNKIIFDLERVMLTDYRIDDFQQTYFVIDSYEQLYKDAVLTDFAPFYERSKGRYAYKPEETLPADELLHLGTQAHATKQG